MGATFRGLILSIVVSAPVLAGKAGTTSASFLELGIGPRAIAMGDAQVAVANDVFATYWNPAGLSQLSVQEIGFVHTTYVESIREQYLSYVYPNSGKNAFGVSMTYLGIGGFPGYDAASNPTGEIDAYDMAVGLSYSKAFWSDTRNKASFLGGVTGKWIQEKLDTAKANAFAADAGVLFSPGMRYADWLNGFHGGVVLRHIGSQLKFDQEGFDLPRTLTAGISYENQWNNHPFTTSLDARMPFAGNMSFGIGGEIEVSSFFLLRAGYSSQGDLGSGLRAGAGFRIKTIQIDYAYAGLGDFGQTHRFGLTVKFGIPSTDPLVVAQEWYREGLKDFDRKRFNDALIKFNKALELDPSHPEALEMMKKTHEQLKTILAE